MAEKEAAAVADAVQAELEQGTQPAEIAVLATSSRVAMRSIADAVCCVS